ncbi:MAG: TatD family hydrolase [Akkermansiaceae bacterium]|nr:TatD family hydrolase [Akkermansiaceae bacterium]
MWIDSHNHLQDPRFADGSELIRAMRRAGVERCVVNATREADWAAVRQLAEDHRDFVLPAYGIHPWYAHTATTGWQDRLRSLLLADTRATVGEIGLDQWIAKPDLGTQMPVFLDQLEISRELDRTATIHCLKAWDALFTAFKEQPPPARFLMHSFGGSIEVARRLIPPGAFFSFSGYFLQPRKAKVLEVFRQLPEDRILLETDAPDMAPPPEAITHPLPEGHNHPANLASIASGLARGFGVSPEELSRRTGNNFRRCFP